MADLPALVATRETLLLEVTGATAVDDLEGFRRVCRTTVAELFASGWGLAWVALDDAGEIRGSAVMLLAPKLPTLVDLRTREGYLLNVHVAAGHRGRGHATRLVETAVAEARRLGLARIRLHATPAGRAVYGKLGFRERADEMELVLEHPPSRE